jgi:serine/threonine protein kinase
VGQRYRIVGLLGRGGMGEVYRADDLKLDQAVALKFLPPRFAGDAARLARLHDEVRIARQISHPNVCRVYDMTEADGEHFISIGETSPRRGRRCCGSGIARARVPWRRRASSGRWPER